LLSAPVLLLSGLGLGALEQTWEEHAGETRLTREQLEKAVLELSADKYGIRDAAAKRLVRAADDRVLTRLMDEASGGLEAQRRSRAMQLLAKVREQLKATTYVKDFWVLGPFPLTADERNAVSRPLENDCLYVPTGLDKLEEIDLDAEVPLRPDQEATGTKLKWHRPCEGAKGTLDLTEVCKKTPEFAHAFLLTFVYCKQDRAATFSFGSDDGIAMWLNGKCIFYGDYHRELKVDSDQVTVDLKAGWNPVLMRIAQGYGEWGVSFRVADRLGRPWPGKWIDPVCGGQKLPAIPAPRQPDKAEKEAVIPVAIRKQQDQNRAGNNLKVQLMRVR